MPKYRRFPIRLLVLISLLSHASLLGAEIQQFWYFDQLEGGTLPEGWERAETKGEHNPATWEIVEKGKDAPSAKNVVAITYNTNDAKTSNLLLAKQQALKNVELSVQIHAGEGLGQSGGGLIWRVIDENHYYLAYWNARENHVRLSLVIGGKQSLIESINVEADTEEWHLLEVIHTEESLQILFDSESLIDAEEKKVDLPGWVGLWAPGDAMPWFDNMLIYSDEEGEE
ncbi:MAG: hypothetical protein O7G87_22845 [bacterium]|nr:hypothetical protein [bacterium]